MLSPFSNRATGGDYSSMAVDAAGRFHPFWVDARKGGWQLYTAAVRVVPVETIAKVVKLDPCAIDSSRIQLLFGEPAWDSTTNEVTVPGRLVNTSASAIVDAIHVRVGLDLSAQRWAKVVADPAALAPKIFDSARGNFEEYATFVYRPTKESPLFSGSVTAPLEWRVHVPAGHFMDFSFQVEISSGGCAKK